MSPIALYFASGESLYAGVVLMAIGIVGSLLKNPLVSRLIRIAFWLGLAITVMASPPIPWPAIAGLSFLVIVWSFLLSKRTQFPEVLRMGVSLVLLLALGWLFLSESSRRTLPNISGVMENHLVVIGDSISSGIDPRIPSWPLAMEKSYGIKIKNLARPGAQVAEGQSMAKEVKPEDHLILIELGGNDLLSGNMSQQFADGLNSTLTELSRPGRIVVMLELPLLPHKIAYGQIQRRLAMQYGVYLVPKKYFVEVISGSDATTDGLHLSNVGCRRMATLVARVLSRVLTRAAPLPTS